MVRRIHGGALLVASRAYEPTFREKSGQFVDEKRRIGAAAAALVESGDTVILSPGTTTMEVARHLSGLRNLTVITSAVNIAAELAPRSGHQHRRDRRPPARHDVRARRFAGRRNAARPARAASSSSVATASPSPMA